MSQFIKTWVTAIIVIVVLNLSFGIFSPIINHSLNEIVLQNIYNNSIVDASHPHNNGMFPEYYASLNSARVLTVNMFNIFGYIISAVILVWAILQSLRREEDTYAG